uniref:Uncharacterized protein n=1 Tax=Brassica oleracea TaxID=3712 RepID=A0A3P6DYV2_BRAOL|nr:unnamed protein product [Brassica oleracea]
MLLPKLERGDESDDGGMETSPRFTRGGFSTRIKEVSPNNFARMNTLLG